MNNAIGLRTALVAGAVLVLMGGAVALATARPQSSPVDWGDRQAGVTNSEYLELYFELAYHSHEDETVLNSFNLVSWYGGRTSADGLLVITQTYNLKGLDTSEPEVRRRIRDVATPQIQNFKAKARLLAAKRRLFLANPESSIVIKHVRATDLQDTLAVTVDGQTTFEPSTFLQAEAIVRARGGVWSW